MRHWQQQVDDAARADLTAAYQIADKMSRQDAVSDAKSKVVEALAVADGEEGHSAADVKDAFAKLEKSIVRFSHHCR